MRVTSTGPVDNLNLRKNVLSIQMTTCYFRETPGQRRFYRGSACTIVGNQDSGKTALSRVLRNGVLPVFRGENH